MSRTILVAEDDESVRELIVAVLSGAGHRVETAVDGADVLTRLAGAAPDLLLLDLHMPVLDGLDVLRRLRAAKAWDQTAVVFLTASTQGEDMVEARRLGARGYLVKPIRPRTLADQVARVLDETDLLWLDDMTSARSGA